MISRSEQMLVATSMKKFGGSFVQSLGVALSHADEDNAQRIKSAFPEYWDGYLDYACAISLREAGHLSKAEERAALPSANALSK